MPNEPSNNDDIIDSRDVIARIDELIEDRAMAIDEGRAALVAWESEYATELADLEELQSQAEGCSDWAYGAPLIRDSYFFAYAQALAEDIGAIADDAKWPAACIDWRHAADELQADYTSVDFGGVIYWIRS